MPKKFGWGLKEWLFSLIAFASRLLGSALALCGTLRLPGLVTCSRTVQKAALPSRYAGRNHSRPCGLRSLVESSGQADPRSQVTGFTRRVVSTLPGLCLSRPRLPALFAPLLDQVFNFQLTLLL